MGRVPPSERGSTLVMVLLVIMLLTVLGATVLQSVTADVDAAGAERGAEEAMYIAEAGIQWALQELDGVYGFNASNPDYSPILALPPVTAATTWGPSEIVGWHQLHAASESMPYASGNFRVVAKPADPPEKNTLLVRSLGIASGGARRLLEVAVQPTN